MYTAIISLFIETFDCFAVVAHYMSPGCLHHLPFLALFQRGTVLVQTLFTALLTEMHKWCAHFLQPCLQKCINGAYTFYSPA